jgi:hypothetical protein
VRDDHVQAVGGAPLKQADEDLSLPRTLQSRRKRRALEEAGTETQRHQRQRTIPHEHPALHNDSSLNNKSPRERADEPTENS